MFRCMVMGPPWVTYDEWTESVKGLYVTSGLKETFSTSWSEHETWCEKDLLRRRRRRTTTTTATETTNDEARRRRRTTATTTTTTRGRLGDRGGPPGDRAAGVGGAGGCSGKSRGLARGGGGAGGCSGGACDRADGAGGGGRAFVSAQGTAMDLRWNST